MIRTGNTLLLKRNDIIKRLYIAIIIFISILGISVSSLLFIYFEKNECSNILENAYLSAKNNETEKALQIIEDFISKWDKKEKLFMLVLHRNDVDDISFTLREIKEFLKEKELPEYFAELKRIMALLDHAYETEMPYFENIL